MQAKLDCIAFDLDGTALDHHGVLTTHTVDVLSQAAAQGIALVVATGRALGFVPREVLALPNLQYAITNNGAVVTHIPTQTCARKVQLPAGAVLQLTDRMVQEGITAEAFVDGKAYGSRDYVQNPHKYGIPAQAVGYISHTRNPVDDICTFLREHAHDLDSMDFIVADATQSERLRAQTTVQFPELHVTSSGIQRVEFSDMRAGKGKALAFVLEQLGASPLQTATFGDADNDLEMITLVRYGVAMAEASDRVKVQARFVTKSNRADGLAWGVTQLLEGAWLAGE